MGPFISASEKGLGVQEMIARKSGHLSTLGIAAP
jgi:hypothetical protein